MAGTSIFRCMFMSNNFFGGRGRCLVSAVLTNPEFLSTLALVQQDTNLKYIIYGTFNVCFIWTFMIFVDYIGNIIGISVI